MTPNGILSPDPDNTPLGEVYKWFGLIGCLGHLDEMKASAIAEATWKLAGIGTVDDPKEIASLLNGRPIKHVRLKPEKPRTDKKGKAIKYESPKGPPNRAYFHPLFSWQEINTLIKPVIITEGEKKSLAACERGFATVALSGVDSWKVKDQKRLIPDLTQFHWGSRLVYIAYDSDRITNPNIQRAEKKLARILKDFGADVRIVELQPAPNGDKTGIDDFFVRGGTPEQFQVLLDAARPAALAHRREKKKDVRTEVIVDVDEPEADVTDQVIAALATSPNLYRRGELLCEVNTSDGDAIISNLDPAKVRSVISTVVKFKETYQKDDEEMERPISPPSWCVKAIANYKVYPGVKPLTMIVSQPVLREDGTILVKPGYDEASQLYLHWPGDALPLPEKPTCGDAVKAARDFIDLVGDFPFEKECHRASALAALLTPLCRPSFTGPTPFFWWMPTSGRPGRANCSASLPASSSASEGFPNLAYPRDNRGKPDEAELRKQITTRFKNGSQTAMFDDIDGDFGDAVLNNLLTAERWDDRILGASEDIRAKATIVWYGTGNNVRVVGDAIRRVCRIRLESPHQRPEKLNNFRVKGDLLAHVKENRRRYLAGALTILKAFHLAGRPDMKLPAWGSYEGWSAMVRNAVVWCGFTDPGEARMSDEEAVDEKEIAIRGLMEAMEYFDPKRDGMTSAQLIAEATVDCYSAHPPGIKETLESAIIVLAGKLDSRKLGTAIGHHKKRVVEGLVIDEGMMLHGNKRWVVRKASDVFPKLFKDK